MIKFNNKELEKLKEENKLLKDEFKKKNSKIDLSNVFDINKSLIGKKIVKNDDVKEPILILINNDGTADIYENQESGMLKIERSDNEDGIINLDTSKLINIKWKRASVLGWIAFEDDSIPYPHNPIYDSGLFAKMIAKLIINVENYQARLLDAKWGGRVKFILVLILGLAVFSIWFLPSILEYLASNPDTVVETVKQTSNETLRNITRTVL